jgi:YVTN family beta-propeller protein
MKKNVFVWVFAVAAIFSACKKDDVSTPAPSITPAKGVYVLSEGGPGSNSTKLAYRDAASGNFTGDFFLQQNPTITGGLGDIGNDAIIYGSKMYIVMNNSSRVTVLNASTATFIDSIPFRNGSAAKQPRFALGYRGKVYVTAWDATVSVIDTTTLTITKTITVGPNPEGLAAVGNYLYVANSGGFNTVPDSTVSVIDLNTNTEIKKITACVNPQKIESNSVGDLYVSSYGDYNTIPATVAVISSATNTRKAVLGTQFGFDHIRIFNDTAYLYNNYPSGVGVRVMNTLTNSIIRDAFITDGTTVDIPYGIDIDAQNGDVYITDAVDYIAPGKVTCFGRNGVKKFSFSVAPATMPNKVLFVR